MPMVEHRSTSGGKTFLQQNIFALMSSLRSKVFWDCFSCSSFALEAPSTCSLFKEAFYIPSTYFYFRLRSLSTAPSMMFSLHAAASSSRFVIIPVQLLKRNINNFFTLWKGLLRILCIAIRMCQTKLKWIESESLWCFVMCTLKSI